MSDDGSRVRRPPTGRGFRDWEAAALLARENRGTWVKVFDQAPRSFPNAHKRGVIRALRSSLWHYELITRNTHGSRADIWIQAVPITTWRSRQRRIREERQADASND